jgi:hypothetical protein
VLTRPVLTRPVLTRPVLTRPVLTRPVLTRPVLTRPVLIVTAVIAVPKATTIGTGRRLWPATRHAEAGLTRAMAARAL